MADSRQGLQEQGTPASGAHARSDEMGFSHAIVDDILALTLGPTERGSKSPKSPKSRAPSPPNAQPALGERQDSLGAQVQRKGLEAEPQLSQLLGPHEAADLKVLLHCEIEHTSAPIEAKQSFEPFSQPYAALQEQPEAVPEDAENGPGAAKSTMATPAVPPSGQAATQAGPEAGAAACPDETAAASSARGMAPPELGSTLSATHSIRSIGSLVCRICHNSENPERLVSPCLCKGSLSFVHVHCLERWITTSRSTVCELCQFQYNTEQTLRYTCIQSLRMWYSRSMSRRALQEDCQMFSLLTLVAFGIVGTLLVGIQYYFMQARSMGLARLWTKSWLLFFLFTTLAVYFMNVYIIVRSQLAPWYRWWQSARDIKLILENRKPFTIRPNAAQASEEASSQPQPQPQPPAIRRLAEQAPAGPVAPTTVLNASLLAAGAHNEEPAAAINPSTIFGLIGIDPKALPMRESDSCPSASHLIVVHSPPPASALDPVELENGLSMMATAGSMAGSDLDDSDPELPPGEHECEERQKPQPKPKQEA